MRSAAAGSCPDRLHGEFPALPKFPNWIKGKKKWEEGKGRKERDKKEVKGSGERMNLTVKYCAYAFSKRRIS